MREPWGNPPVISPRIIRCGFSQVLIIGRNPRVADQHAAPDGQETHPEKTNVTVDTLTGFYARYSGLPSRFRNGAAPGQQTGHLSARHRPTPGRRQWQ